MAVTEKRKLFLRALTATASELVPYFWPMRNFIHHNPLYNFEKKHFEEATKEARHLFHARTLPSREYFRKLYKEGRIREDILKEEIDKFLERFFPEKKEELKESIFRLLISDKDYDIKKNLYVNLCPEKSGKYLGKVNVKINPENWAEEFAESMGRKYTLYDVIDLLFGTDIGKTLDDLMIKLCMEFLDEGQAVWGMPLRERGFFYAWGKIAVRSKRLKMCGCTDIEKLIEEGGSPEEAIEIVLKHLGIPEELWEDYLKLESFKLHGWMGYIRWRTHTKEYYWQKKHPISEADYLAVRLIISLSLIRNREKELPFNVSYEELKKFILQNPEEAFLRYEYFSGNIIPSFAEKVYESLKDEKKIKEIAEEYIKEKEKITEKNYCALLSDVEECFSEELLKNPEFIIEVIEKLREEEGYVWLKALERTIIDDLVLSLNLKREEKKERPLAQALFCIDVRSERFRRNLERIGDYETYGIAGFFGIPISFVDLKKGHETYLCPVLIKPKNVVLEVYRDIKEEREESLAEVAKEILHDLKYNVFTPYITVEAIGLLFGFDMIGKTLFPLRYSGVRERITEHREPSKLMIDKLTKEEAVEVISLLQREVIRKVLREEWKVKDSKLTDKTVESIRKIALEEEEFDKKIGEELGLKEEDFRRLIEELRNTYRIERGYMRIQLEKLAKIGFTLDEQVFFVERALRSIGLTDNFGKIVLVLGHGSKSDNNPYESALDCGACGGDHGIVNARVFALMANKKEVREKLRERGINIPEDTVFIPGEHNTTTDEVELYDLDTVPPEHMPYLRKVIEDLKLAGKLTALERCKELPTSENCKEEEEAFKEVLRNSVDWTQVRPEWGLSGNYAFIVGRRELTKNLNLRGKVFLHSYDYRKDPKGLLLEIILSGPLVVGEWINMEHFFSAVDNERFGSGSKVYHNVVGRFGVVTGNYSDLRTGLPAQTVLRGKEPFHTPVRLITVVEAPFEFVKSVIDRLPKVRELVYNEWINMVIADPEKETFYHWRDGEWKEIKKA